MRILILTGGTGSIALQRGLYNIVDSKLDGVETKILVNAYDNGLSTGVVRHVMGDQILGPSDVRKNQATRLKLSVPDSPWIPFLDSRFTCESQAAPAYCKERLDVLVSVLEKQKRRTDRCGALFEAIDYYFSAPLAARVRYIDFSLANILYAGLAGAHRNSLRAAASVMAAILGIPDSVLINDDKSLFLGATTRSGRRVTDEGEIVAWQNEEDPFSEVFFYDKDGKDDWPVLCVEAWQAIVEADLIILSSGTQWSSLIPTYVSRGFKDAIRSSNAKILMVMNRKPDKDSPSQSASDIIDILVPQFFDEDRLHVLIDERAHPKMSSLSDSAINKVASCTKTSLSSSTESPDKHDPHRLAVAVGRELFKEYLDSEYFLFDYDDTLVGRGGRFPRASQFNVEAISRLNEISKMAICTGNTIKSISLDVPRGADDRVGSGPRKLLTVFADGGVNKYTYVPSSDRENAGVWRQPVECIFPDALFTITGLDSVSEIIQALQRAGIPAEMIDNRNDALIAIKPIDAKRRGGFIYMIRHIIRRSGAFDVRESGRSTVEIHKKSLSKAHTLRHLKSASQLPLTITYVGDECLAGNDRDIHDFACADRTVKCLQVHSLATTAFFISTLTEYLQENAQR